MRHWLGSVLCASFSALTVLVRWQIRHLVCTTTLFRCLYWHLVSKNDMFQRQSYRTIGERQLRGNQLTRFIGKRAIKIKVDTTCAWLTDSGNIGILCIEHEHVNGNLLRWAVERQLLVEVCYWRQVLSFLSTTATSLFTVSDVNMIKLETEFDPPTSQMANN